MSMKSDENELKENGNAIESIYWEKEDLLILGLTGRTGSGCSTVAKILSSEYPELALVSKSEHKFNVDWDALKMEVVNKYVQKEGEWEPFEIIEVSSVIFAIVLNCFSDEDINCSTNIINYLNRLAKTKSLTIFDVEDLTKDIKRTIGLFDEIKKMPLNEMDNLFENSIEKEVGKDTFIEHKNKVNEYYELYICNMSSYKQKFSELLSKYPCLNREKNSEGVSVISSSKYNLYKLFMQSVGNNIRASGNPFSEDFDYNEHDYFAEQINLFIKLIETHKKIDTIDKSIGERYKVRICIDAIRNVYESNYLHDHYRTYYLLSINTNEDDRKHRLITNEKLDNEELKSLDNIENPNKLNAEEIFFHQDISTCIQMADIHILNTEVKNMKFYFLTWQLIRYIVLMVHPGLVTPSPLERCMQLAYNVKFNSGCLSRQVGAVVTGNDFSIKSVGWNDVPKGQIPCNLRDVTECDKGIQQGAYSDYENNNSDFGKAIKNISLEIGKKNVSSMGRKFPFCFKDIHNGYTKKNNQVHTRALHAEENAFLQISKYGGQGVKDGYLFVTASPCELCSKKAYQLGIRNIYYIDPYPGISQSHILSAGNKSYQPKMNLFFGAIGEAYIALYRPLISYKDELELLTGIKCKEIAANGGAKPRFNEPEPNELFYGNINISIQFNENDDITEKITVKCKILSGSFQIVPCVTTFFESTYDSIVLNKKNNFSLIKANGDSGAHYYIDLKNVMTENDSFEYTLCCHHHLDSCYDFKHIVYPVKYKTKKLNISIIVPKEKICNVKSKKFADLNMLYICDDEQTVTVSDDSGCEQNEYYCYESDYPIWRYSYGLSWEYNKQ